MHFSSIAEQSYRLSLFRLDGSSCLRNRIVNVFRCYIDLLELQSSFNTPWVHLDENADTAVEGNRLRLRSAHLAEARRQN